MSVEKIARASFICQKEDDVIVELETRGDTNTYIKKYTYDAEKDHFTDSYEYYTVLNQSRSGNGNVEYQLNDGIYEIKFMHRVQDTSKMYIKIVDNKYTIISEDEFLFLITTDTDRKEEEEKQRIQKEKDKKYRENVKMAEEREKKYLEEQEKRLEENLKDLGKVIFVDDKYKFITKYHPKFVTSIKNKHGKYDPKSKTWTLENEIDAYRIAKKYKLELENENMFDNAKEVLKTKRDEKKREKLEEEKKKEIKNQIEEKSNTIETLVKEQKFTEAFKLITQDSEIRGQDQLYLYKIFANTENREIIEFGLNRFNNDLAALLDNSNLTKDDIDFIKSKADLNRPNSVLTKKLIEKKYI